MRGTDRSMLTRWFIMSSLRAPPGSGIAAGHRVPTNERPTDECPEIEYPRSRNCRRTRHLPWTDGSPWLVWQPLRLRGGLLPASDEGTVPMDRRPEKRRDLEREAAMPGVAGEEASGYRIRPIDPTSESEL